MNLLADFAFFCGTGRRLLSAWVRPCECKVFVARAWQARFRLKAELNKAELRTRRNYEQGGTTNKAELRTMTNLSNNREEYKMLAHLILSIGTSL